MVEAAILHDQAARGATGPKRALAAATIGLAFGISATATSSFNTFILPLAHAFGWPRGDVAFAMMVLNLVTIVSAPVCGWLIDRVGLRRVLLPSVALFGLGWLLLSLIGAEIWQLYLGYAFVGAGGIGTSSVAYSRLIVPWFPIHQGRALGVALAGMGIGVAVIPVVTQGLIMVAGWRAAYRVLALIVTIPTLMLLIPWARDPKPVSVAAHSSHQLPGLSFGEAMKSRSAVLLFLTFPLLGLLTGAIATHLVPLIVDRGLTATQASLMTSILGLSLIVGRVAIGWLLDRLFAPMLMGAVIAVTVVGLIVLLSATSPLWIMVAIFLIGFAIGADGDFLAFLVSRYIGLRAFSRVLGFQFSAFAFGLSFGPALMGVSANMTGGYSLALEVLIGTTTLAILPIAFLGPYPDAPMRR